MHRSGIKRRWSANLTLKVAGQFADKHGLMLLILNLVTNDFPLISVGETVPLPNGPPRQPPFMTDIRLLARLLTVLANGWQAWR